MINQTLQVHPENLKEAVFCAYQMPKYSIENIASFLSYFK